jgi:hypothetical protein
MAKDSPQTKYTEQNILNNIYDQILKTIAVTGYGWNGQQADATNSENLAVKVTESGSITYVGLAAPGTPQSSALWQCKKVDETTGTVITWCDGDALFDNVATDLTALTYS